MDAGSIYSMRTLSRAAEVQAYAASAPVPKPRRVSQSTPPSHSPRAWSPCGRLHSFSLSPHFLSQRDAESEHCWLLKMHKVKAVSFTWGKMSSIARETAPQVALRDCPEAVGGRSVSVWFWPLGNARSKARVFVECCCWSPAEDVTRKEFSAFLDMKRCKHCTHKISPWECLKPSEDLFCQFLESTECLIAALHPECFRSSWRSAAAVPHDFILVEGDGQHPWQVRICSWQHPALNTIFKGTKIYHTLRQQVLWPLLFKGLKNNK